MDPEPSSLFIALLSENSALISGLILLLVLLLSSALVSGSEVALFSLTKSDIDKGIEDHPKAFTILSKLLKHPKKLLATILVANNFINIGIVILFAFLGEIIFQNIELTWLRFYWKWSSLPFDPPFWRDHSEGLCE